MRASYFGGGRMPNILPKPPERTAGRQYPALQFPRGSADLARPPCTRRP